MRNYIPWSLQMVRMLPIFFFFNDTATTEIYTLSLHDALPICSSLIVRVDGPCPMMRSSWKSSIACRPLSRKRSEEHTSELQSRSDLVCRLLLEKKKPGKSQRPRH